MINTDTTSRPACHYYTWYKGPKELLQDDLDIFLNKVDYNKNKDQMRGMIVPHAGIMHSGSTAAWGFKNLIGTNFKRIFILCPTHFVDFKGFALTKMLKLETPFCNLNVDKELLNKLKKEGNKIFNEVFKNKYIEIEKEIFHDLDVEDDFYEHSMEMQLPFLGYIYQEKVDNVKIVPILLGNQNTLEEEQEFAKLLLEYYLDEDNFFIVSEDFCHWGDRYGFTYHDEKKYDKIYKSIEFLDYLAFDAIKKQSAKEFKGYINEWKNNLCGNAAPVTIFCSLMELAKKKGYNNVIELNNYKKCNEFIDNSEEYSVSYATLNNYKC